MRFPDKELVLKDMDLDKKSRLQMIGSKKTLKWKQTRDGVEISVPENVKSVSNHVWVIKVENP
jgi:hypothetical protein